MKLRPNSSLQSHTLSSLSDFEIISELGKGSFGYVYKVIRKTDKNIYALKKVLLSKLKAKERENSLNEIRLLASIANPNIIEYKDAFYDSSSSCLCLIMEFAECGDLEKTISQRAQSKNHYTEGEILSIFIQVVKGLKGLHDANVMHRDIKTANIFLFKDDIIKIGDLNVSKLIKSNLKHTQTGTPYYASPEVWENMSYDYKSDIWSVGCLLYELCAFRAPFRGTTMKMVYEKVRKGLYDPLPEIYSRTLSKLVYVCLQNKPKNRPTCEQLLNIIYEEINGLNINVRMTLSPHCALPKCFNKKKRRNLITDLRESKTEEEEKNVISNGNIGSESKLLLGTIKMPQKMYQINNVLPKSHYAISATRRVYSASKKQDKLPKLLKSTKRITNTKNDKESIVILQRDFSAMNIIPKKDLKGNYIKYNNMNYADYNTKNKEKDKDRNDKDNDLNEIQEDIRITSRKSSYVEKDHMKDISNEKDKEQIDINAIQNKQNTNITNHHPSYSLNKMQLSKKQNRSSIDPNLRLINHPMVIRRKFLYNNKTNNKENYHSNINTNQNEINNTSEIHNITNQSINNKTANDPRELINELRRDISQIELLISNINKNNEYFSEHRRNKSQMKARMIAALIPKENNTPMGNILMNKDNNNNLKTIESSIINNNNINKQRISNMKCINMCPDIITHKEKHTINLNQLPTIERSELLPTAPSIKGHHEQVINVKNAYKQSSMIKDHSLGKRCDSQKNVGLPQFLNQNPKLKNIPIKLLKVPFDNKINFESNQTIAQDVNRIIKCFKIINNQD